MGGPVLSCPSCRAELDPGSPRAGGAPACCPTCGARFVPDLQPADTPTSGAPGPYETVSDGAGLSPGTPGAPDANQPEIAAVTRGDTPTDLGSLGPYRLRRVLGEGGMGRVYLAEDVKLRRTVALKVMRPECAADASARRRFLREAQAQAAIEHDHIVTIYQVDEDSDVPYLVMPLLRGETLAARLKREGALGVAEVLRIGREIAEGLAAAHERGLVHRDIKPGNIFLEAQGLQPLGLGRVKVLDFGLARAEPVSGEQPVTRPGSVLGTPGYMAPEQAAGKPVDARADLFSLGCVLYRMATGEPPFKGPDTMAVLMALANSDPPAPTELNPGLPRDLSALILKLLAKRPEERCQSAAEVIGVIRQIGRQVNDGAPRPPGEGEGPPGTGLPAPVPAVSRPAASAPAPSRPRPGVKAVFRGYGCTVSVAVTVACIPLILGIGFYALRFRPRLPDQQFAAVAPTKSQSVAVETKKAEAPAVGYPLGVPDVVATKPAPVPLPEEVKGAKVEGLAFPDLPAGPPDVGEVRLGRPRAAGQEPPLLVQLDKERGDWKRVGPQQPDIFSNRPLVALPGSRAAVQLKDGVQVTLWGTLPELLNNPAARLYESRVELYPTGKLNADLTLERGRILLTATGAWPAFVRVRHEDPRTGTPAFCDVTLESKGTTVLIERLSYLPPEEPFFEKPTDPRRAGPTAQLNCAALSGTAGVKIGGATYSLTPPPGAALVIWNSVLGIQDPRPGQSLPPEYQDNPPPRDFEKFHLAAAKARDELAQGMAGKALDVGLAEAMKASDTTERRLALRCYGAIDELGTLMDRFEDEGSSAEVRATCIDVLRGWVAHRRDNDDVLLDLLKKRYNKAAAARNVVKLLHRQNPDDPVTYEVLIDGLDNPLLPIRALSAWHLYQLVPAGQKISYSPTGPAAARSAAQSAWRDLIPRGQLPPRRTGGGQ